MNDTNNPADFARTLADMVGPALIDGAEARQVLLNARAAFDAGNVEQARIIVSSYTVPQHGGDKDSIQNAVYRALPRTGPGPDGGM